MNSDKNGSQQFEEDKMQDSFLSQLLSYKSQLIDQVFVDNLMKRIKKFERVRYLIIAVCALVGSISLTQGALFQDTLSQVASFEWPTLPELAQFSLFNRLTQVLAEQPAETYSVVVLASMLTLAAWLVATD